MKSYFLIFGIFFGGVCSAQTLGPVPIVSHQTAPKDSTVVLQGMMQSTETSFLLEKFDLIRVSVASADVLSGRMRISTDGHIEIPLAGTVNVGGLTVAQAQDVVSHLIREKGLVLDPAVTIDVLETPGRVVSIAGAVKTPGVYPIVGGSQINPVGASSTGGVRTLGQLIALAGGLLDTSSDVVTLTRPSLPEPISIPLGTDPNNMPYTKLPLMAGDQIEVPHGGEAYVIGAVGKQGVIPLKNFAPTTVTQAISLSNGIGFQAAQNDARLVRVEGDIRTVMKIEMQKVIQGKAPDVALRNGDILYIPTVAGKAALKSGAAGLIVSLASTYIYSH